MQAQREFAYSEMVIKPLFLCFGRERGATEIGKRADSPRDTGSKWALQKKRLLD